MHEEDHCSEDTKTSKHAKTMSEIDNGAEEKWLEKVEASPYSYQTQRFKSQRYCCKVKSIPVCPREITHKPYIMKKKLAHFCSVVDHTGQGHSHIKRPIFQVSLFL